MSVGKLIHEAREGGYAVTEWKCDTPIAVAGFNYGEFKLKKVFDEATHYDIETYATVNMPGMGLSDISLTPSAMAESALITTQNAIRVFSQWFGISRQHAAMAAARPGSDTRALATTARS